MELARDGVEYKKKNVDGWQPKRLHGCQPETNRFDSRQMSTWCSPSIVALIPHLLFPFPSFFRLFFGDFGDFISYFLVCSVVTLILISAVDDVNEVNRFKLIELSAAVERRTCLTA